MRYVDILCDEKDLGESLIPFMPWTVFFKCFLQVLHVQQKDKYCIIEEQAMRRDLNL